MSKTKNSNSKRILSVTIRRMIDDSPDTSWLGTWRQDYERMESLSRGDRYFLGIRADAEICLLPVHPLDGGQTQTITSGGLFGINSDSDKAYLESIEQEQLAELKQQLRAIGFSTRAISKAFQNIERKDS